MGERLLVNRDTKYSARVPALSGTAGSYRPHVNALAVQGERGGCANQVLVRRAGRIVASTVPLSFMVPCIVQL